MAAGLKTGNLHNSCNKSNLHSLAVFGTEFALIESHSRLSVCRDFPARMESWAVMVALTNWQSAAESP